MLAPGLELVVFPIVQLSLTEIIIGLIRKRLKKRITKKRKQKKMIVTMNNLHQLTNMSN